MTLSAADPVKIDDDSEILIGPSGTEILKREINGLEKFKKSRMEERYHSALQRLAYRWFEINYDEFNQLKPEQITALEILADQKTKRNLKIWGWTNIAFVAGIGVASFLVSLNFLFGLSVLLANVLIVMEVGDDCTFRTTAKGLNKKFDPKLMLETKKPQTSQGEAKTRLR